MQPKIIYGRGLKPFLTKGADLVRTAGAMTADWLLPPSCLVCSAAIGAQGSCCPRCWSQLRFISNPICPVMGTPFSHAIGKDMISAEAIADPPPFDRLRAVVLYDELSRRLVSGLKFHDRVDLATHMANWMVRAGRELLRDAPIIVPVPLYAARLVSRRYNQSAELSRAIAQLSIGVPNYRPDLIKRHRPTRQQVGLTQAQRERNVSGAFRATRQGNVKLAGAHVLVVDDVYTTGATIKAVVRCLKRAGAVRVDVLVFAKVDKL